MKRGEGLAKLRRVKMKCNKRNKFDLKAQGPMTNICRSSRFFLFTIGKCNKTFFQRLFSSVLCVPSFLNSCRFDFLAVD